jgi:hypothetical protein
MYSVGTAGRRGSVSQHIFLSLFSLSRQHYVWNTHKMCPQTSWYIKAILPSFIPTPRHCKLWTRKRHTPQMPFGQTRATAEPFACTRKYLSKHTNSSQDPNYSHLGVCNSLGVTLDWRTEMNLTRMMLRRVALVRTDVSEEHSASIIRVTRIGELGTTLACAGR